MATMRVTKTRLAVFVRIPVLHAITDISAKAVKAVSSTTKYA